MERFQQGDRQVLQVSANKSRGLVTNLFLWVGGVAGVGHPIEQNFKSTFSSSNYFIAITCFNVKQ